MANDVVDITDEVKEKLRDFDEQEAYFLLCEIFSYAQATKDYAKFQIDLNEWKKRYPIDLFSEQYKSKIKYMLSKEFLDTVLKNFVAFDELSKKDPAVGLEKLRKILSSAEKHKDAKKLDSDLSSLYAEYPLNFLKQKYPHIVPQLVSKTNRARILQKFDSENAFKELTNITEHPQNYKNANEFKEAIEEWQKLYPTADFNDNYKSQVERTLNSILAEARLEELFPVSTELDLSLGQIIPIEPDRISIVSKDALYDLFKIIDKNKGNIDSLFNWMYTYSKYMNAFDLTTKNAIVSSLMSKYAHEMPPVGTHYRIPQMDSNPEEFLSLTDYSSIKQIKKDAFIQLLGILSTEQEVTPEDRYRLNIIHENAEKADIIKKAKIEPKLDVFMQSFPEDELTPSDNIYLNPTSDSGGGEVSVVLEDSATVPLMNDDVEVSSNVLEPAVTVAIGENTDLKDSSSDTLTEEQESSVIAPSSEEIQDQSLIQPSVGTEPLSEDELQIETSPSILSEKNRKKIVPDFKLPEERDI